MSLTSASWNLGIWAQIFGCIYAQMPTTDTENPNSNIYTVSQNKVHPFYFCDYSIKCQPILLIFGNNAADKNLQLNDIFLSYIHVISSLCTNITE